MEEALHAERAHNSQYERAVLEVHPDGVAKVYGTKRLLVRVLEIPVMFSDAARIRHDTLTTTALPKTYRDVYWPAMVRAVASTPKHTLDALCDWRRYLRCVRALKGAKR